MRTFVFLFSMALLFSCHQSSKIPDDFDYGKTENGIYKNLLFNMEVPLPGKWIVQNEEQIQMMLDTGSRNVEQRNKKLGKQMRTSLVRTAVLLSVFKYRTDSSITGFNPYLIIMAEKLSFLSGVNTAEDYLDNLKKTMSQVRPDIRVTSDYSAMKIGGKEFTALHFIRNVGEEMDIKRTYYVEIEKGFALILIVSYSDNEHGEELAEVLDRIKPLAAGN